MAISTLLKFIIKLKALDVAGDVLGADSNGVQDKVRHALDPKTIMNKAGQYALSSIKQYQEQQRQHSEGKSSIRGESPKSSRVGLRKSNSIRFNVEHEKKQIREILRPTKLPLSDLGQYAAEDIKRESLKLVDVSDVSPKVQSNFRIIGRQISILSGALVKSDKRIGDFEKVINERIRKTSELSITQQSKLTQLVDHRVDSLEDSFATFDDKIAFHDSQIDKMRGEVGRIKLLLKEGQRQKKDDKEGRHEFSPLGKGAVGASLLAGLAGLAGLALSTKSGRAGAKGAAIGSGSGAAAGAWAGGIMGPLGYDFGKWLKEQFGSERDPNKSSNLSDKTTSPSSSSTAPPSSSIWSNLNPFKGPEARAQEFRDKYGPVKPELTLKASKKITIEAPVIEFKAKSIIGLGAIGAGSETNRGGAGLSAKDPSGRDRPKDRSARFDDSGNFVFEDRAPSGSFDASDNYKKPSSTPETPSVPPGSPERGQSSIRGTLPTPALKGAAPSSGANRLGFAPPGLSMTPKPSDFPADASRAIRKGLAPQFTKPSYLGGPMAQIGSLSSSVRPEHIASRLGSFGDFTGAGAGGGTGNLLRRGLQFFRGGGRGGGESGSRVSRGSRGGSEIGDRGANLGSVKGWHSSLSQLKRVNPLLAEGLRGGAIKAFGDPNDPWDSASQTGTRYELRISNTTSSDRPRSSKHSTSQRKAADVQLFDRETGKYIGGSNDIMQNAYGNPHTYKKFQALARGYREHLIENYGEETANRASWGGNFFARQGKVGGAAKYNTHGFDQMHFSLDEGGRQGTIAGGAGPLIQADLRKHGVEPTGPMGDDWKSPYLYPQNIDPAETAGLISKARGRRGEIAEPIRELYTREGRDRAAANRTDLRTDPRAVRQDIRHPTSIIESREGSTITSVGQGRNITGGAGIPQGTDPKTIAAINRVAKSHHLDPAAIAQVIKMESNFNPRNKTGSYVGMTQIGGVTMKEAKWGITSSQFRNLPADKQVDYYGKWLDHYKFDDKVRKFGVDPSKLKTNEQAAMLQAFQFSPNGTRWLKALGQDNIDVRATGSPQAGALGRTTQRDMRKTFARRLTDDPAQYEAAGLVTTGGAGVTKRTFQSPLHPDAPADRFGFAGKLIDADSVTTHRVGAPGPKGPSMVGQKTVMGKTVRVPPKTPVPRPDKKERTTQKGTKGAITGGQPAKQRVDQTNTRGAITGGQPQSDRKASSAKKEDAPASAPPGKSSESDIMAPVNNVADSQPGSPSSDGSGSMRPCII